MCIPADIPRQTPPGRHSPNDHCSGRHASYWNAFLLSVVIRIILSELHVTFLLSTSYMYVWLSAFFRQRSVRTISLGLDNCLYVHKSLLSGKSESNEFYIRHQLFYSFYVKRKASDVSIHPCNIMEETAFRSLLWYSATTVVLHVQTGNLKTTK